MLCIYAKCKRTIPEKATFCPWCGRKQLHEVPKKKRRRQKGTGSVYKVPGKRQKPWIALKDGHSIGSYFATEREAQAALEALIDIRDVSLFNLTLQRVYERWSATAYVDCKKSFVNDYSNAWKHFPDDLRGKKFREIKSADVQGVIDQIYKNGLSNSVQQKVKSLYAFLCGFGMANDIISKDYSQYLTLHSTPHKKDSSVFSKEELDKIMELAEGPCMDRRVQTARIILVYLFTGMRLSELLPLPRSAVHLEGAWPHLIGGEKTEAGIDRVIPIISNIRPYVQWFYDNATGPKLFSAYVGNLNPQNWRARDYYALLDSLEIERHTPHGTRRTTATLAVEARVDPAALQKIGGWKEFATIQKHYNKPNLPYLYGEMEKLGNGGK